MSNNLLETLGNEAWMRENENAVKALLPQTWTHMQNLNVMQLGFGLKLLGVDWRSEDEFGRIMVFLERIGLLIRQNDYHARANPRKVFPTEVEPDTEGERAE